MKFCCDYHLHTRVSDGRCSVFSHIKKAEEKGLEEIAITDHGFASTLFHVTRRKLKKQKELILSAQTDVKVLQGIEANLLSAKGDIDVPLDVIGDIDLLIAGFHRYIGFQEVKGRAQRGWLFVNGFGSRKAKERLVGNNTSAYVNAMRAYPIDVITHLNHRAPVDVKRVCEVAKETGVYIELNEKHVDALENHVQDMLDSGVNFIVGTDAHDNKKTGKFDKVAQFIKKYNIPEDRVYGINGRKATFKNKAVKK